MDDLFKSIFSSIVLRNKIFKSVTEINKSLGYKVKKYNSTNYKWIISNKQFQLLLYKLKQPQPQLKNDTFNIELFFQFLRINLNIEILKQLLIIIPSSLLLEIKESSSKIIENICILNVNKLNIDNSQDNSLEILKYLIKELNIDPQISIKKYLSIILLKFNFKILKYFIDNNFINIENESKEIKESILFCILNGGNNDIEYFEKIVLKYYNDNDDGEIFKSIKTLYHISNNSTIEILNSNIILNSFKSLIERNLNIYWSDILRFVSKRNDFKIMLYFLEIIKFDGNFINGSIMFNEYCKNGNLECCKFIYENVSNFQMREYYLDAALLSKSNLIENQDNTIMINWLIYDTNTSCTIFGLYELLLNISNKKHWIDIILNKFRSNFSNQDILNLIHCTETIYSNINNFNYLSSFLPNELIPSFPIQSKSKFYEFYGY